MSKVVYSEMVSAIAIRNYRVCVMVTEIGVIAAACRAFSTFVLGPWHYFTYWVRAFGLSLVIARLRKPGYQRVGRECANVILNVPLFIAVGRDLGTACTLCSHEVEDVFVHCLLPIMHWIDFFAFQASESRGGLTALMTVNVFCILYCLYIIITAGTLGVTLPYGSDSSVAGIFSFALSLPGLAVICLLKRPLQLNTWRALLKW